MLQPRHSQNNHKRIHFSHFCNIFPSYYVINWCLFTAKMQNLHRSRTISYCTIRTCELNATTTYHSSLAHSFLLGMLVFNQFICLHINIIYTILMVYQVFLKLVKLLLQHLDVLEVLTKFIRRHKCLFIIDPEHDLVTFTHELYQPQSLLQFQTFLLQALQQQIPKPMQLFQSLLIHTTTNNIMRKC